MPKPARPPVASPWPKPTWEPLPLRCRCGNEWDDWQPNNVPPATWIAHIRALSCPACGNRRKLFIRTAAPTVEPA